MERPWMAPPEKIPAKEEDLGGAASFGEAVPSKPPLARTSPAWTPIIAYCIANTVCLGARAGEFLLGADVQLAMCN